MRCYGTNQKFERDSSSIGAITNGRTMETSRNNRHPGCFGSRTTYFAGIAGNHYALVLSPQLPYAVADPASYTEGTELHAQSTRDNARSAWKPRNPYMFVQQSPNLTRSAGEPCHPGMFLQSSSGVACTPLQTGDFACRTCKTYRVAQATRISFRTVV